MTPQIFGVTDLELLAAAANAHVYRGLDADGVAVAVKVLRIGGEAVVRRFERERRAMERLIGIDNIATIHASGVTAADEPFLVMPLYAGSVQDRLDEGTQWDHDDAVAVISTVAAAVAAAHSHGVLHLDIKPANILLDEAGTPFLADFGIAEFMESTAEFSATMLTPSFSAPERFEDTEPGEGADVYALGATLLAMLSGRAPFSRDGAGGAMSTMRRILTDPVPVADLPDGTPPATVAAIEASMAKEPSERTPSATAFVEQLHTVVADPDSTVARPDVMSEELRRANEPGGPTTDRLPPSQRPTATKPADIITAPSAKPAGRRGLVGIAVAASVVLLGGLAFVLGSGGGDDEQTTEVLAVAGEPVDDSGGDNEPAAETTTAPTSTTTVAETTTTIPPTTTAAPATTVAPAALAGGADPAPPDGILRIGAALPFTGTSEFTGPAPATAIRVAVDEINAAGGVLGEPVEYEEADTRSEREGLFGRFQDLRGAGADVIMSVSGESLEIIQLAELTSVPLLSIQPTAPHEHASWDSDWWFGFASHNVLEGAAIGQLMFDDGHRTAAVISDSAIFRNEMLDQTATTFEGLGGTAVAQVDYDISRVLDEQLRANLLSDVIAARPDAVAVFGFDDQVEAILRDLFAAGMTMDTTDYYADASSVTNLLARRFEDEGSLAGLRGAFSGYEPEVDDPDFVALLKAEEPLLRFWGQALTAYDTTIVVALAAEAAGSDTGTDIGGWLQEITAGGTKCTTFVECRELIRDGVDIDYDGRSGPIDLSEHGDPLRAVFTINELDADGRRQRVGTLVAGIG